MSDGLTQVFDVLIVVTTVALAGGVLFIRNLFRTAVLFIVFGLVLAIAWVRLDAVDIALAEAAIGAGLLGVLVVGAASQFERGGREPDGDGE